MAQLRRETPCVVQAIEDEWREVHEVLVRIVEPRARRQREDCRIPLDVHAQEADRSRAEEARPCVGQLAVDGVEHSAEQNTVLETNVDEGRGLRLINTGIKHVSNADRGGRRGQGLQTDRFKRALWIQGYNADGLVFTTNSLSNT